MAIDCFTGWVVDEGALVCGLDFSSLEGRALAVSLVADSLTEEADWLDFLLLEDPDFGVFTDDSSLT
ncbi:hypothetical protein [Meiothermus sp.]|uniref:hypothetical protein n=1 Tax=Meiothermus sp. TaxID=1955249 RepID=UPI00260EBE4A|nr:hypothetical protein [Meiothermus sp.]